jgi:hypothetical protein
MITIIMMIIQMNKKKKSRTCGNRRGKDVVVIVSDYKDGGEHLISISF